jgi:hypothetical protein
MDLKIDGSAEGRRRPRKLWTKMEFAFALSAQLKLLVVRFYLAAALVSIFFICRLVMERSKQSLTH